MVNLEEAENGQRMKSGSERSWTSETHLGILYTATILKQDMIAFFRWDETSFFHACERLTAG